MPVLAKNKKALFDYTILDRFEAGIVLAGHEVKSVRQGQVSLKGAYVTIDNKDQAWLLNASISKYKKAAQIKEYDPTHSRKLLLNKKEIAKIKGKLASSGLTIVPISLYTKGNLIKAELGLAQGKKKADKRQSIKEKDTKRDIQRALKRKMQR